MVGMVNRPHTRRMTPLRTTTSVALFQFDLSHVHDTVLFDSSEALESTGALTVPILEIDLVEVFNKLPTDAVYFAAIFQLFAARALSAYVCTTPT